MQFSTTLQKNKAHLTARGRISNQLICNETTNESSMLIGRKGRKVNVYRNIKNIITSFQKKNHYFVEIQF